jgi:aminobenzoyl-glutamate utilization protein A
MDSGYTALWADLPCSGKPGSTLAFRFDMDANSLQESAAPEHRPGREGFASRHPGCMHACGHDGHTALGLGLAALLPHVREHLRGSVRLIFQPAEEGGSGARPMLEAGVMDGVDYLVGIHVGIRALHTGSIICGAKGFMASSGFDARYAGSPAHAGLAPHEGRNALLAACSAALGMYAITRHGDGASRVNVGQLQAGQARNVIPDSAVLKVQTRGISTEIDSFVLQEALRIARAAGDMWNCDCEIFPLQSCPGGTSSAEMSARIARIARSMPGFTQIAQEEDIGATEDFTVLLEALQRAGGQGAYIQLGAERAAGHHSDRFDFDENALPLGL